MPRWCFLLWGLIIFAVPPIGLVCHEPLGTQGISYRGIQIGMCIAGLTAKWCELKLVQSALADMVRARAYPMALTKMGRGQAYPDSGDPGALAKMWRATAYPGALSKDGSDSAIRTCKCSDLQRSGFERRG